MSEITIVEIAATIIVALMGGILVNFQTRIRDMEQSMPEKGDERLTSLEADRIANAVVAERLANLMTTIERLTDQVTNGDVAIFRRIEENQAESVRWRNEVYAFDIRQLHERINLIQRA